MTVKRNPQKIIEQVAAQRALTLPRDEPEVIPADRSVPVPTAKVQKAGNWHLVTFGSWQISVDPTGLLMLPRHLHPEEFAEFVACGQIAVDIGTQVRAENEKKAENDDRRLGSRQAILTQRGTEPAAGTVRMRTDTGQSRNATIGRAKRRGTANTATKATPTRRSTP